MGGYNTAHELLNKNREQLDTLAQALLDRETLNADEINAIFTGKSPEENRGETDLPSPNLPADTKATPKDSFDDSEGVVGGGLPDPSPA